MTKQTQPRARIGDTPVWCAHDKIISTAEAKPNPRNNNTHPANQIELLGRIIRNNGWRAPITISARSGFITKGHGRLYAAQDAGMDSVPVEYQEYEDETAELADLLADNQIAKYAEFDDVLTREIVIDLEAVDFDLELTGFSQEELDAMLGAGGGTDGLTDPDDVPEPPEELKTKPGDLYALGDHRLLCGDSTKRKDVERLMNGEKADMVFTDPPYGVSYADKNAFLNAADKGNRCQTKIENDHMSVSETADLWAKTFRTWAPIHADHSSYYIASPQGGELFLMMMMMMNENKHPLKHCIVWAKNNHVLGRSDYNYKHEPILYGWQRRHRFYGKGDQKFSVWHYDKPLKNDLHPTMKPVDLIINAILNSTEKGMAVADYFLGSGSTLIACEQTNRRCYGMEIDPHYCDVIVERWENFTGKKAKLIDE